jgi:hypothetical protein
MTTLGEKIERRAADLRSACALALVVAALALLGGTGSGIAWADVVITEIMYNPNSFEPLISNGNMTEWVEIYNAGSAPVDISGWYLSDEDGSSGGLPPGSMLGPKEAAVIHNEVVSSADFQAAWGTGFQNFGVSNWGLPGLIGLSNSPSPTNEILTLRNASGQTMDVANYDDDPPWPSDVPDGPSIYVLPRPPCSIGTANDDGANWARSAVGVDLGRANVVVGPFNGNDVGSPGSVVVVTDPVALLNDLMAQVTALGIPQSGGMNGKLSDALKVLARGNNRVAVNKVHDFIDQVNGLIGVGSISASAGASLLCAANEILAVLPPASAKALATEQRSWGAVKDLYR